MRILPPYWFRNILCSLLISLLLLNSSLSYLTIYGAERQAEVTLVALLIDQDVLDQPSLKTKIERYAAQIQSQEQATKVLLVPVSPTESPWNVSKILQKLYFQGDNTPNEINHLSGIVLIGDVPLPVVYNGEHTFVSVYPYTDFVDPLYIYDVTQERYTRNGLVASPQPEILHGIIRPPVTKGEEYYTMLASYFDKNTAYRTGDPTYGQFDSKIFYSDLPKELRVISELDIAQYELFKTYWEDISYMRYNKHFLDELMEKMEALQQAPDFADLDDIPLAEGEWGYTTSDALADIDVEDEASLPPTAAMPDGIARGSIMQYLKSFDSGFSNYLSTLSTHIEGTGRYQTTDVDTFFTLIAKKDQAAMTTIRRFNDLLEIAINDTYVQPKAKPILVITTRPGPPDNNSYLFGLQAGSVSDPSHCSLYNGTLNEENSVYVEENRTFNFQNAGDACWIVELSDFKGCGSSCANVDKETGQNLFSPKCNYIEAKLPVMDPKGTREITSARGTQYRTDHGSCYAVNFENGPSTLDSDFCTQQELHTQLLEDPNYGRKYIPSIRYHVEPTNTTLCYHSGGKLENGECTMEDESPHIPQAMPIDNPRRVSFYMPNQFDQGDALITKIKQAKGDIMCAGNTLNTKGNIGHIVIEYPNFFRFPMPEDGDRDDIDTALRAQMTPEEQEATKYDYINDAIEEYLQTIDGDIENYILQYITPTGESKTKGATTTAWEQAGEVLQTQLVEALRWKDMSLQEKYEFLFAEQLSPISYVSSDVTKSYDPSQYADIAPRKPLNGYEIFYLVADGTIHDQLPLQFTLEPIDSDFKNLNLEKQLPIPQDELFCNGEYNKYQETVADGRWPKAIKCWLEELTVPTFTFKEWNWFSDTMQPPRVSDKDNDGLHDAIDLFPEEPDHDKDGLLDGQNALAKIILESENRLVLHRNPQSTTVISKFFTMFDIFMEAHSYDLVRFESADPSIVRVGNSEAQQSYFGQSSVELFPGEQAGATTISAVVTHDLDHPYSPQFVRTYPEHDFIRPHFYDASGEEITELSATSRTPATVTIDVFDPVTGIPLPPTDTRSFHILVTDQDPAYPNRSLSLFSLANLPQGSVTVPNLPFMPSCVEVVGDQKYCGEAFLVSPTESSISFSLQPKSVGGHVKVIIIPIEKDTNTTAAVWGKNAVSTGVLHIRNQREIRSQPFQVFNTEKKVDLRAMTLNNDTPLFIEEVRVGGEDLVVLTARLTDINENNYEDLNGLPIRFRITHPTVNESPATFVVEDTSTPTTEITTTIVNGIATAALRSTDFVGTFTVEAFVLSQEAQFYPGSVELTTFSDAITRMTLESPSDIIINGKTPVTTQLQVFDAFDNAIEFPNVDLTVTLEGAITTATPLADYDGERPGFQVPAPDVAQLELVAVDETVTGTGTITISYTPSVSVTKDIRVIQEGSMSMDMENDMLLADGVQTASVSVTLRDEAGTHVRTNDAVVSFQIQDVSMGTFVTKHVQAVDGIATTTLQSGIKAGTTTISATSFGYRTATHPLTTLAGPPAKLQFHIAEDTIIPPTGATIAVGIYDAHGNFLSTHSGTPITLTLSEATAHKATISGTSSVVNGLAEFTITPTNAGELNLIATSGNLEQDKVSIKSQFTIDPQFVKELQPQTLYASLLGMPFGNAAMENYIGGWWLFSGKTQAVTAMTAPIQEPTVIAKVEPNGNVFIGGSSGEQYGRSLRFIQDINDTIGFELFDEGYNLSILKFFYHLESVILVEATADTPLEFDENRFYVHHLRDDLSQLVVTQDRMVLRASDRDLVSINSNGTLRIIDNTIQIETITEANTPVQLAFTLSGETLATVTLTFKNLPVMEANVSAPTGPYISVERTSTLTQHQLRPVYFGASTANNRALALMDVQDLRKIHNHPFRGLEDVLEMSESALGFRGDNMYLTLFAAGNTVGASTKGFAGETLINLGDPYLKLGEKTLLPSNSLGMSSIPMRLPDKRYGALVTSVRDHSPFAEAGITTGDIILAVNGQGMTASYGINELLQTLSPQVQRISVTFLHEGQEITKDVVLLAFTPDMGKQLLPASPSPLVGMHPIDVDGDGDMDLLLAQEDGYIRLLENTQTSTQYRDRGYIHHVPDGIKNMSIGEFTGDTRMDFIIPTERGRFALFKNIGGSFLREDLNLPTRGAIYFSQTLNYDGDGHTDIVTADESGDVRVFLGRATPLGSEDILLESHPLTTTHPLLQSATLNEEVALYYPQSPAEFPPLVPFLENDAISVTYQGIGTQSESTTELENPEFVQEMQQFINEYQAYPVAMSPTPTPPQTLSFLPPSKNNFGNISTQKTLRFDGAYLQTGSRVFFDITLTNNTNADIPAKVLDRRSGIFQIQMDSLTCTNCGDDAHMPKLSPHGDYDVFVDEIIVPAGKTSTITYSALLTTYPELSLKIGNFGRANVLSEVPKEVGSSWIAHAQVASMDNVITQVPGAPTVAIPAEIPSELEQLRNKEIKDPSEQKDRNDDDKDEAKDMFKYYTNDVDGDGIPNALDPNPYLTNSNGVPLLVGLNRHIGAFQQGVLGGANFVDFLTSMVDNSLVELDQTAFRLSQTMERALCSKGGGCFEMPINYAFMVPGEGSLPVPSFTMPVFAAPTTWYFAGIPTPGIWPPFWEGTIEDSTYTSQIRFYIAPTLTGSIGTAVCLGPHDYGMKEIPMIGPVAPNANCFVFFLDDLLDALGIAETCAVLKQTISSTVDTAQRFVTGNSFGVASFSSNPSGGKTSYAPAKRNIRPTSFPEFLTNWMDKQLDEIITKLTKLPNIYIILPDFEMTAPVKKAEFLETTGISGIAASTGTAFTAATSSTLSEAQRNTAINAAGQDIATQTERMSANLKASVDEFYDWLGALPFLKIDRRPIVLQIPWIDQNTLRQIESNVLDVLADTLFEFEKFKILLSCELPADDFPPMDSDMIAPDILGSIGSSIGSEISGAIEAQQTVWAEEEAARQKAQSDAAKRQAEARAEAEASGNAPATTIPEQIEKLRAQQKEKAKTEVAQDPTLRALQEGFAAKQKEWAAQLAKANPEQDTEAIRQEAWDIHGQLTSARSALANASSDSERSRLQGEVDSLSAQLRGKKRQMDKAREATNICAFHPELMAFTVEYNNFISSLSENLQALEAYKKFPAEIKKYLNWKSKYMGQVVNYVDTVVGSTVGYIQDNKIIVKRWIQSIDAVKDALKTFQALLDVFLDYQVQCATCRNDRGNGMNMVVDLISSFLPEPPILKFQKWPDIVLDVSHIQPVKVVIPEFAIQPLPVHFPRIQPLNIDFAGILSTTNQSGIWNMSDMTFGSGAFSIPELPVLPRPPKLPELPNLPPIPEIKLPYLPPAPKIPNLSGGLKTVIKIGGSVLNMFCLLTNNQVAIPEWQLRRHIEDLTERKGLMALDFLKLSWPQVPMPYVDSIHITTYVDFQLPGDFIYNIVAEKVQAINTEVTSKLMSQTNEAIGKQMSGINKVTKSLSDVITNSLDDAPRAIGNWIAEQFTPVVHDPTITQVAPTGTTNELLVTLPHGVASRVQVTSPNSIVLTPNKELGGFTIGTLDGDTSCTFNFDQNAQPYRIAGSSDCLAQYQIRIDVQAGTLHIERGARIDDHMYTPTGTGATIAFADGTTKELTITSPADILVQADIINGRNILVFQNTARTHGIGMYYDTDKTPVITYISSLRDLRTRYTLIVDADTLTISPLPIPAPVSYLINNNGQYLDVYSEPSGTLRRLFTSLPSTFQMERVFIDGQHMIQFTRTETGDQLRLQINPDGTASWNSVQDARDIRVAYQVQLVDNQLSITPRAALQSNWYRITSANTLEVIYPTDNTTSRFTVTLPAGMRLAQDNEYGISYLRVLDTDNKELRFLFSTAKTLELWTETLPNPLSGYTVTQEGMTLRVHAVTPSISSLPVETDPSFSVLDMTYDALEEWALLSTEEVTPEDVRQGYQEALVALADMPSSFHLESLYDAVLQGSAPIEDAYHRESTEALLADTALAPAHQLRNNLLAEQAIDNTLLANVQSGSFYSEATKSLLAEHNMWQDAPTAVLASTPTTPTLDGLISRDTTTYGSTVRSYDSHLAMNSSLLLQQYQATAKAEEERTDFSDTQLTQELSGLYVYDMQRREGIPLLANTTLDTTNSLLQVVDVDMNGTEDILYTINGAVYLKKNTQKAHTAYYYPQAPTYVTLESLLLPYGVPTMLRVTDIDSESATLTFMRTPERTARGYEITLYPTIFGQDQERIIGASTGPKPIRYFYVFNEEDRQFYINSLGIAPAFVSIVPPKDIFEISLTLPNSMYYATVTAIGSEGRGVSSAPVLLPLSSHADSTPPRIQILQGTTHVLHFFDTLALDASASTDDSGIAGFSWDLNDQEDTDLDGNFLNDTDSTEPTITVGPFDYAHTRTLHVTVTDIYGNSSMTPVTIHVQPPDISIDRIDVEQRRIEGHIEPPLAGVHLNVARDRYGSVTMLQPIANRTTYQTDDEGKFSIDELYFDPMIEVQMQTTDGYETIASVHQDTGVVTMLRDGITLAVEATSPSTPFQIHFRQGTETLATLGYNAGDGIVTQVETLASTIPQTTQVQDMDATDHVTIRSMYGNDGQSGGLAVVDTATQRTIAVFANTGDIYLYTDDYYVDTTVTPDATVQVFTLRDMVGTAFISFVIGRS